MAQRKKNTFKKGIKRPGRNATLKGRVSDQHMRVINEYFHHSCNFNKRKALMRAGYSEVTAKTAVTSIFQRPEVKAEIERRFAEINEETMIDAKWLVRRLVMIANISRGDVMEKLRQNNNDLDKLTEEERYAVSELVEEVYLEGRGDAAREVKRTKVKFSDPLAAIAQLARVLGLNKDKMEIGAADDLVERLQAGRARMNQQRALEDKRSEAIFVPSVPVPDKEVEHVGKE